MLGGIYTVLAFILALAVLIIVHEFGHYWVAKTVGVKVLRFSIGFGRPLWSRHIGQDRTELVVAAIPLGGYVKMLDEMEGDVPEAQRHRAFNRQSILKRTAIVAAGPIFNFLFAIVAYWIVFMVGVDGIKPVIGKVEQGSIAERAGLQRGDELLTIDGMEVRSWGQHRLYLFRKALDGSVVEFESLGTDGIKRAITIDFAEIPIADVDAAFIGKKLGLYGYFPEIGPIVGSVEGDPASAAGLLANDEIVEIDGKKINSWTELVEIVSGNPGVNMRFTVRRADRLLNIDITPTASEDGGRTIGRINIRPKLPVVPETLKVKIRYNPFQSLLHGVTQTWSMSILTLKMLYKMVKLEVSTKNISGPITIAQYAGYSAQIGIEQFLMFLAVVSISLGILNLLPIPILDGGHLLYYLIEAVKGSPVSENVMHWGQQIGLLVLIGIMVLAFYNDLTRLFQ